MVETRHPGIAGEPVEIPREELEERDEIVGIPVAVYIRLAEADPRPQRKLPPEIVRAMQVDDHPWPQPVTEPAAAAVRMAENDLPAPEAAEGLEGDPSRNASGHSHGLTVPRPGTKGGLAKYGTRLSASRAAWRWMSEITLAGISG